MSVLNKMKNQPGRKVDWVTLVILLVFLVVGIAAALVAYSWARGFFSTTTVIDVGNAPPLPGENQPSVNPQGTAVSGQDANAPAPMTSIENIDEAPKWNGSSRVSILVMGMDYRDWSTGIDIPRTDTMILFSIDPVTKTAGMLSIPRDMWVSIPGFGYNKINTAYRVGEAMKLPGGGAGLAMKTVENFIGVPVNYAVLIDFNAFVAFFDELGGLDMHIREPIKVDPVGEGNTVVLEPGVQTLDGATVLAYARNRYTNDGDFDRSKRQQEVVMALRQQILQFNQMPMLLSKAPALYQKLSSGIHTTLTLDQMIQLGILASQVKEENIKQGVFDPHHDVNYASVVTADGQQDILVPNPDQIRMLRDSVFANGGQTGPAAVSGDLGELMKAESARVLVKNGSATGGLAAQAGERLRGLGVNVTGEGNADQATGQTTIIDHTGKPYTSRFLIEKLNLQNVRVVNQFDPNAAADLELVVGDNFTVQ